MSEAAPPRVAMFHNTYTRPGGEDLSTEQEVELLRSRGVPVTTYLVSNAEAVSGGALGTAGALWRSAFNRRVYRDVRRFCRQHRPTVAHVQNFWFALSPSVHAACHAEGVATVQTLRNYRLLCVNATLLRDGRPCELCVGRSPWPGVALACYRGSRPASALVARMIVANRRRRTWERDVDVLVALTRFARERLVAGGLPGERIVVEPNFLADPGPPAPPGEGGVFVGRLSPEKGIDTLLAAWGRLPEVPLRVVGDGPQEGLAAAAAAGLPQVTWHGRLPPAEARAAMRRAAFVVMASRWYEGFPRVLLEAMAEGRAAVVPRLGSMAEIVEDGVTGLHFAPDDAADLAAKVERLAADPALCAELGRRARRLYEERYTADRAFERRLALYRRAAAVFAGSGSSG